MKKWLISSLIAITALSLSTAAYATNISLKGKKVQSEVAVKVNGIEVATGIVIDGTTFIPVRKAAEVFSVDVAYKNGEVTLVDESKKKLGRIKVLTSKINLLEDNIKQAEEMLIQFGEYPIGADDTVKETVDFYYNLASNDLVKYKQELEELQKQRDELINELSE